MKTCGWTKSFQCWLKRKSLRSTRKEIFGDDVLGVSGKPLSILCIHNKCYCAEIKRAAVIHQRARSCCYTARPGVDLSSYGIQSVIKYLFSLFCGRCTNHLPNRADVVTRQRATDARLLFLPRTDYWTLRGQPKGDLARRSDCLASYTLPTGLTSASTAPLMQRPPRRKSRAVDHTRVCWAIIWPGTC